MKYGYLLMMASLLALSTNAYGQGGSTSDYEERIFDRFTHKKGV